MHDTHTVSREEKLVVKGIIGKLWDTWIWTVFQIIISMFSFWTMIIVSGYIRECSGFSGCTKHTWVKCHHQICNSQMVQHPPQYRSSMCRQWVIKRERKCVCVLACRGGGGQEGGRELTDKNNGAAPTITIKILTSGITRWREYRHTLYYQFEIFSNKRWKGW